jgi:hypothetical protein
LEIIVIIGRTVLFEPQPSLEDSIRMHLVFTSLDFETTIFFLRNKVPSLASNCHPDGPGLCVYVPQLQGSPIIPQASGSIFVAFCDFQGYSGDILARLHLGQNRSTFPKISVEIPKLNGILKPDLSLEKVISYIP